MLPYLRLLLFAAGVAFYAAFGATVEHFIVEVLRHWVSIDPGNVVAFNALNIGASILPLLGVALLLHVAIGSERGGREILWAIVWGVVFSVAGFRVYQVAWVLKTGTGSAGILPPTPLEAYFFEKFAPCALMGLFSFLPLLFIKTSLKININICFASITLSFIWLLSSQKIFHFLEKSDILMGFLTSLILAYFMLFLAKKAELI